MKAKKLLMILLIISTIKTGAFSQVIPDSSNMNIQIKVNKDTSGNYVRYDSTVVITWHSDNFTPLNADSIYQHFFGDFKPFYQTDSTFAKFFDITPDQQLFDMEKEFQRMDEMFIRQMQMIMNGDFFENFDNNNEKKFTKPHNKKTSGTVKSHIDFNTVKI
jgi:hypothetical protein